MRYGSIGNGEVQSYGRYGRVVNRRIRKGRAQYWKARQGMVRYNTVL